MQNVVKETSSSKLYNVTVEAAAHKQYAYLYLYNYGANLK